MTATMRGSSRRKPSNSSAKGKIRPPTAITVPRPSARGSIAPRCAAPRGRVTSAAMGMERASPSRLDVRCPTDRPEYATLAHAAPDVSANATPTPEPGRLIPPSKTTPGPGKCPEQRRDEGERDGDSHREPLDRFEKGDVERRQGGAVGRDRNPRSSVSSLESGPNSGEEDSGPKRESKRRGPGGAEPLKEVVCNGRGDLDACAGSDDHRGSDGRRGVRPSRAYARACEAHFSSPGGGMGSAPPANPMAAARTSAIQVSRLVTAGRAAARILSTAARPVGIDPSGSWTATCGWVSISLTAAVRGVSCADRPHRSGSR